ncbi:T9SS type A sorting domain-containing protein [Siansivirga zeaxanthinifaciens]|nr:T9SS type A sorting domain-containing protein [Siansivirga zeaxanthinifaciens]
MNYLIIFMLFLLSAVTANAQAVPLQSSVIAGFGVDADIEADIISFGNLAASGTDDWFDYATGEPGKGIIDISSIPAGLQAGANVAVQLGMAQNVFYVDSNNRTWLDALYARDQRTNGNNKDATVFGAASDKNIANPLTWTVKNGDVPQKNDIIDVYAHLRREAPFGGAFAGQEFALVGASTRSQDGTSYIDFEYFRGKIDVSNTGLVYEEPLNYGLEGGHTAFKFDTDGIPTQLGDIILSVNYTNGGNVADIRIFVWVDLEGIGAAELQAYNALPNLPFLFGDGNGGFDYYDGGTDAGTYGYAQIVPKGGQTAIWAQVNSDAVEGTPWPTIDKGGSPTADGLYPQFGFAEIAINATAFGLDSNSDSGAPCESPFGSFLVKTRSSDSFVAELKDLVGPFDFGDVVEIEPQIAENCTQGSKVLTASLINPGQLIINYSWFKDGVYTGITGSQFTVTEPGIHTYTVYATAGTTDPVTGLPDSSCFNTAQIDSEPGSDLSILCPTDPNISCTDQTGISTAFTTFLGGLNITGGVGTVDTKIYIGGTLGTDCVATGTLYDNTYQFPDFSCVGGSLDVHFVVSDECGQIECCTATFTVLPDTKAPTFDAAPADIADISCDAALPTQETLTASDDCSTVNVVASVDPYERDICGGNTITYRWVATDACNNETVVTKSFNILPDTKAPTFDADPADIADISCDAALPTQETLTASDDCSMVNVVAIVDPYERDICGGNTVTYRWVATDACNNETVVTKSFNILPDTKAPTFDAAPADIADISCDAALPTQETLTDSDDCSTVNVVASVDPYVRDICGGNTVTYRWVATDACNNETVVTKSFNILPDTKAPTFDAAPADIADISCDAALPTQETLTASDDCSTVNVVASVDPYVRDICGGNTVTYRWVATDACNNETVVTKSFNILPDTKAPTFDAAPADIADISCDAALPTQETLTASDDCSTVNVVASVDPYERDICGGNTITYRWVATDACNNETVVTKSFNILPDTKAPTFDAAPADIADISCDAALPTQETLTASDDCSTVNVVASVDPYERDICGGNTITYRWVATDACNNETVVTKSFNILPDTKAPTFDADPADIADISCDAALPTQETLTASDDCSTVNVVASVDPYERDICGGNTITYRWVATDACNNETVVTKSFNILPDTKAPTFDADPADIADISCDAALPTQETLTASDDCSTVNVVASVDPYVRDICGGNTVTYRWVATDACNNETVVTKSFNILPDTKAPTFDADPADIADISCDAALPTQETLTASDDCSTVNVVASVDPYERDICGGNTITYRWVATDACNNETVVTKSFNILPDTKAPTFDAAPADIADISCDAALPTQETLTASDDCSTVNVVASVDPYERDICGGNTITYRWVATDACNNETVVTKSFNILPDTKAPTFDAAPADIADISCDAALPTQETLTASDDCSTVNVVASVDPYVRDICGGNTVTYRWVATDACNNETVVTKSFNILPDTKAPTFDADPADIADISCDAALPTQETLTASDDCSTVNVVASVDPYERDICGGNTITYRWVATDACNNETVVTKSFNILPDTKAPTFDAAPADIADISCDAALPTQETLTASDDCSTVNVVASVDPYERDICGGNTITYRWVATDACNNETVVTKSFNILPDTKAPTFDAAPADIADISCDAALPTQETLTASDDCSTVNVVASVDPYERDICGGNTITYRWVATDACNNETVVTKSFNILPDTEAPYFTQLPEVQNLCNDGFPEQLTATWADACSGGDTTMAGPTNIRYREDMCAELADYVFTAVDNCGNMASETVTVTREIDKYDYCETAFARDTETSSCFIPDFKRWGWTNAYEEGAYAELPLYAGAAQCDYENKGALVGSVTVDYSNGSVTVTYNINEGYSMSEAHVYVGCDEYPSKNGKPTVAPGQYTFNANGLDYSKGISVTFTNVSGPIYVIAHAVTCEELCRCSPRPGVDDGNEYTMDLGISCNATDKSIISKTIDFEAYPVPFNEEVNIKYNFDFDTDITIEVFDMKGSLIKKVKNIKYTKGTFGITKINLSKADNQMFLVKLTTKEGTVVKKIVSSSPQ